MAGQTLLMESLKREREREREKEREREREGEINIDNKTDIIIVPYYVTLIYTQFTHQYMMLHFLIKKN
jgi:hypothetical protein